MSTTRSAKGGFLFNALTLPYAFAGTYCLAAEWVAKKRGQAERAQKLRARYEFHVFCARALEGEGPSPPRWW